MTILLRDLYRASYAGKRFAQSYAVTSKVLDSLPHEVTEGVITVQPSADVTSPAYELAKKRLGIAEPDSYETQATDWASLVSLAIAKAKVATGTGIRDNVRKICQGSGTKVYSAVEGLKLLAQGTRHQLRRRERSLRLHRDRRHRRLQVPLQQGDRRKVRAAEGRLTPSRSPLPQAGEGALAWHRSPTSASFW